MREVQTEQQMVQVRLVRLERRLVTEYPHGHHPHGVEHGNRQHREAERHKTEILRYRPAGCRAAAYRDHDEICHHGPHQHRASIPDEHLRGQTENVVKQKWYQCADAGSREERPVRLPENGEERPEGDAGEDAEPRTQAVDPVYQVDRIDDSHTGEHRQRNCRPIRQPPDSPQPVEIVHTESCSIYERKHDKDFDRDPQVGGKPPHVVRHAHAEHHSEDAHQGQGLRYAEEDSTGNDRDGNPEGHRHAAQYRDRLLLQLPSARIVRDVLCHRYPQDMPVYPPRRNKSGNERHQRAAYKRARVIHIPVSFLLSGGFPPPRILFRTVSGGKQAHRHRSEHAPRDEGEDNPQHGHIVVVCRLSSSLHPLDMIIPVAGRFPLPCPPVRLQGCPRRTRP